MEIDPKQLSKWLKTNGLITRTKFCEELGISMKTSYQWTSESTPIPLSHRAKIHSLMHGLPLAQKKILADSFLLTIDERRYRAYELAAKSEGMGLKEWLISVVDQAAALDNALPNPYTDCPVMINQGTAKQETANASLPSPAESPDPASDKHTTREILGILRLGTNPDAKRESGTV